MKLKFTLIDHNNKVKTISETEARKMLTARQIDEAIEDLLADPYIEAEYMVRDGRISIEIF